MSFGAVTPEARPTGAFLPTWPAALGSPADLPDGAFMDPGIGHNSILPQHDAGAAADRLKSLIERIEKLEEEKAGIGADIKELYGQAKGVGFDVKIMRQVIKLRKMDSAERDEQEQLLDVYKHALGMV